MSGRTLSARGERIGRGRARRAARGVLPRSRIGCTRNWQAALKRPPDNLAEAERRRDLAMRGDPRAHRRRSSARRARGDEAIAWVERTEGEARYEVNAAPFDVAEFLARGAVRAHAERRADQRDDRERRIVRVPARARSASTTRRSTSRPRRSIIARKRGSISPRARAIPKSPDFARRAAPIVEEMSRSHERPRVRALHVVRAPARSLRALARAHPVPAQAARRFAAHRLLDWFRATPNAVLFATATFWEGHRRRRRSALVRDHRPAAVPLAGRSARRGAARRDRSARRARASRSI